jgi:hypothetical protein
MNRIIIDIPTVGCININNVKLADVYSNSAKEIISNPYDDKEQNTGGNGSATNIYME